MLGLISIVQTRGFINREVWNHPSFPSFNKEKSYITWFGFNSLDVFFWHLWLERNHRFFNNTEKSIDIYLDNVIFVGLSWCKLSPLTLQRYNLGITLTNELFREENLSRKSLPTVVS